MTPKSNLSEFYTKFYTSFQITKLEIILPETATKFLHSQGLKIEDYDEWHDEQIVNRCLIIKSKQCLTSFKENNDFDTVFAPNLEAVLKEQFADTNVKEVFMPLMKTITDYGFRAKILVKANFI